MSTPDQPRTFFAVVIGTGFAGAVTACRLVEAGFDICVLERGRRYGPDDFPRYPSEELFSSGGQDHEHFAPPPDFSRWLWSRDHGLYDIRDLDDALSVQAAGYGGGSLIYANVHLRPPRELFEQGWPKDYRQQDDGSFPLEPYFDLAAHMLQVSRVPKQLAKTLQLEDAAGALNAPGNWFRTPLAINFDERSDTSCDMRGRCCVGCDRGAKNTLDLNYLAKAENKFKTKPDIRTLAEVTRIHFDETTHTFTVIYNDLLFRSEEAPGDDRQERSVHAKYVFLCAGSISTTELLMKNPQLWDKERPPSEQGRRWPKADNTPLGSHYFPNADSLAAVFDCDHPHEADYGPTITSSFLYQREADNDDEFRYSLDFCHGRLTNGRKLAIGAKVRGRRSGAVGDLSHPPLLDWGTWKTGAAGALVLKGVEGHFIAGEDLDIGGQATATARSTEIVKTHWFMTQDGGYPPDLEPLIGVFRSPIWVRRNRYIVSRKPMQMMAPRRSAAQRLNVPVVTDSLRATAGRAGSSGGFFDRVFDPTRFRATELFSDQLSTFFPPWFIDALRDDHKDLLAQAAAAALPMVGRLLGELSKTVAQQIDSEMVAGLIGKGGTITVTDERKQVLIRGVLRLALQIFAGSEAAIASKATTLLLDPIPQTPEGLLRVIGGGLLWALAYGSNEGHTALVLTMGRDPYRGRLTLVGKGAPRDRRLTARLPGRLLDSSSVMQERVLRAIARKWGGELRTNPSWAVLGKRVTVHNQGGCPMGPDPDTSVTSPSGEVHKCPGLYVMDASAFPTSVGVNPSATIAAIAEFKIERFIREHERRNETWADDRRRDKDDARVWVDDQDRAAIDPLNHNDKLSRNSAPALPVLGLTFCESMEGAFDVVEEAGINFDDPKILNGFRKKVGTFVRAEDKGTQKATGIDVKLTATASDLARLISRDPDVEPVRIRLCGSVILRNLRRPSDPTDRTYKVIADDSYMQLFVRPPREETPPLRFFRYKVRFMEDGHVSELNGLKVLRDSPGLDVWSDTSTLYFEISRAKSVRRGVLRISVNRLQDQLKSITVTGTGDPNDRDDEKGDPARKSWGLVAFYRYFIGELITVYVRRPNALKDLLGKVITASHV